jgi:outer membrane lipoprotein LolB
MRWGPARAELDNSGEVRKFESFSALAATVTGTDLPLSALFQWLSGTKSEAPGWQVDLSQFDQGRITARRITPLPEVDLRIILAR